MPDNRKNEAVMEYISSLKTGDKVSVRSVAASLGISMGTAYKYIKIAETQGLVATKPKVGTIRISELPNQKEALTLGQLSRRMGFMMLSGSSRAEDLPVPPIVIADGSIGQLRSVLRRVGAPALCLVGDRPVLQITAMELGAELLLTGGAAITDDIRLKASRWGRCILSTEQSSAAIIARINQNKEMSLPVAPLTEVRDWMQMPKYLYGDDILTEWHRLYNPIFLEALPCAIVNNRLKICGSIDGATAVSASPQQPLSHLMGSADKLCIVDECESMTALSEKMLTENKLFAYVTDSDGMTGFISAADVMRYERYSKQLQSFEPAPSSNSRIELILENSDLDRRIYTVNIEGGTKPSGDRRSKAVSLAAIKHASELLGGMVKFESGTFFVPQDLNRDGEFMLSSELLKHSKNTVILQLELFDDASTHCKCIITLVSAEP